MRIASIITAVVVTLILFIFVFQRDKLDGSVDATEVAEEVQTETPAAEGVHVVVTRSKAQVLQSAVILRGETEAARMVTVTAETPGRVISEPLRKGAYVNEGDVLCDIDPGTRAASFDQAKARLSEAEVTMTNTRELAKGGFASDTQVLAAEAGLEAARAALLQAERDIENLRVKAPFDGLLETDAAELGAFLGAGSPCANVIQLDPIKLVVFAPEVEVNRIEVGALAGGRLVGGQEVTGRVTFLARSADPQTRTFRVEVEIPNPDFSIRAGQTVELAIAAAGEDSHLVKQSALTLNNEGEIGVRIIDENNITDFAPVTIIRDSRDGIWVSGLPDEVNIITVGQEYVSEGVLVTPTFSNEEADQ